MFQYYPQLQELQQPINSAECSHTSSNHPLPFLLAAHHVVKTPVSAHLSRPVRSSVSDEGEHDDRSYYSYPAPKPKPKPYGLASFSSAESLPSPVPSESPILSSSSSSSPSPPPSQAETWPTSLSNDGQVRRLSLGGVSPPRRSGDANIQHHQFYATSMHNPQQQQQQQQQQQRQQSQQEEQQQQQQATNLGGKTSGDYDDTPSQGSPSRGTVYTYTSDEMFGDRRSSPHSPKQHTMWILIYLSFLSPFLTLPIAIYTLLITPILILLSPLSLLTTSYPSLHIQLHRFLSPPINVQLDFILSSTTLHLSSTFDDDSGAGDGEDKPPNSVMLLLVNILSPIYAIGICLSAWVAALFWFYAAILGDPDTGCRDGRDDGRAAVLGVRRWWEGWLEQAR